MLADIEERPETSAWVPFLIAVACMLTICAASIAFLEMWL